MNFAKNTNSYESSEGSLTSSGSSDKSLDLNTTSLVTLLIPAKLDQDLDDAYTNRREIVLSSQGSDFDTNNRRKIYPIFGKSSAFRLRAYPEESEESEGQMSEEIGIQKPRDLKVILHRLPEYEKAATIDGFTGDDVVSGTSLLVSENSCNAVDNKLSNDESVGPESRDDLSFNGKIETLVDPQPCKIDATVLEKYTSTKVIYKSEMSPDIFATDDESDEERHNKQNMTIESNDGRLYMDDEEASETPLDRSHEVANQILNEEKIQLKRINSALSGVLPPPSVTTCQMDINQLLRLYKYNCRHFAMRDTADFGSQDQEQLFLAKPRQSEVEAMQTEWPAVALLKAHGITYNRSTTTERIEDLSLKYVDHYVGSQTRSSFGVAQSPSSSRKRNMRKVQLRQSPGSRLSHLAKRRAMFSSANLLNRLQTAQPQQDQHPSKMGSRQILVNTRRSTAFEKRTGKSPKRLTPGKKCSPKLKHLLDIRSSAPTLTRETSKRALFQSPEKEEPVVRPTISAEVASRVDRSRRVLFSPTTSGRRAAGRSKFGSMVELNNLNRFSSYSQPATSNSLSNLQRTDSELSLKRARGNDNDETLKVPNKYARLEATADASALKFARSQSFCSGVSNPSLAAATLAAANARCSMFRASSELVIPASQPQFRPQPQDLTENQRKKLLWAVSQTLKGKQIGDKHEKFREYAATLARVTKRLFLEGNSNGQCGGGGTSEKMMRVMSNIIYAVLQGKSVDEVYLAEKMRLEKLQLTKAARSRGYVAPNDHEGRHNSMLLKQRTVSNVSESSTIYISENSFDSSSSFMFPVASQSSTATITSSQFFSQSSEFLHELGSGLASENCSRFDLAPLVQPAPKTRTNSSSKNNEAGNALRENFDIEQRQKSNQKNVSSLTFSGKDQKNVSPYFQKSGGAGAVGRLLTGGNTMLKAKRQISFDS